MRPFTFLFFSQWRNARERRDEGLSLQMCECIESFLCPSPFLVEHFFNEQFPLPKHTHTHIHVHFQCVGGFLLTDSRLQKDLVILHLEEEKKCVSRKTLCLFLNRINWINRIKISVFQSLILLLERNNNQMLCDITAKLFSHFIQIHFDKCLGGRRLPKMCFAYQKCMTIQKSSCRPHCVTCPVHFHLLQ